MSYLDYQWRDEDRAVVFELANDVLAVLAHSTDKRQTVAVGREDEIAGPDVGNLSSKNFRRRIVADAGETFGEEFGEKELDELERDLQKIAHMLPRKIEGTQQTLSQLLRDGPKDPSGESGAAAHSVEDLAPEEGSERYLHAMELLQNEELLDEAVSAMNRLGHVGEEEVKKLAVLCGVSARMGKPIQPSTHAQSSAGKNYLWDHVLDLLPPEIVFRRTGLTAKALFRTETNLKGAILYIQELTGSEDADFSIRVLQSAGYLEYEATEKMPDGSLKSVVHRREGPTVVVQTTTKNHLHPENETRVFPLYIDESEEQTERIVESIKKEAAGEGLSEDKRMRLLEQWRDAFRLLQPDVEVVIPFAKNIEIPSKPLRIRRDARRIMDVIRVLAWLHQYGRPRDEEGRIEATEADFHTAVNLVSNSLTRAWRALTPGEEKVLAAIQELEEAVRKGGFKRRDLDVEGITNRQVNNILNSLAHSGHIDCDWRSGPQGYSYSLAKTPEEISLGISLTSRFPDEEETRTDKGESTEKPPTSKHFPFPDSDDPDDDGPDDSGPDGSGASGKSGTTGKSDTSRSDSASQSQKTPNGKSGSDPDEEKISGGPSATCVHLRSGGLCTRCRRFKEAVGRAPESHEEVVEWEIRRDSGQEPLEPLTNASVESVMETLEGMYKGEPVSQYLLFEEMAKEGIAEGEVSHALDLLIYTKRVGVIDGDGLYPRIQFKRFSDLPKPPPLPDQSQALSAEELATFEALEAIEPALSDLAELSRGIRALDEDEDPEKRGRFCANSVWYGYGEGNPGDLNERLRDLVGWHAPDPRLRSSHAYDLAFKHIYALLPDCRRCWCTGPLYPTHPDAIEEPTWEDLTSRDARFEQWREVVRMQADTVAEEIVPNWLAEVGNPGLPEDQLLSEVRSVLWHIRGKTAAEVEDYCAASPQLASEDAFNRAMTEIYGPFYERVMRAVTSGPV